MSEKTELLPCPFCGSPAKASKTHGRRSVWCSNQSECHNSAMYSRETWNTRHLPEEVESVIGAARKLGDDHQGCLTHGEWEGQIIIRTTAQWNVLNAIRNLDKGRKDNG